jgi:hypothetical protein
MNIAVYPAITNLESVSTSVVALARLSGITTNQMAATERDKIDGAITNGQAGVSLSGTTTLTNLVVAGVQTNLGNMRVEGQIIMNTGTNMPGVLITGTGGGTSNGKPLLTLWNTNSGPSGTYSNETHLRLRAGVTNDSRSYIGWQNYAGTDRWLMGHNGGEAFIFYDALQLVHRMFFPTTNYSSSQGGITAINSCDTQDVRMNWYPSGNTNSYRVGNGMSVWAPGASVPFVVARANNGGVFGIGTNNPAATLDVNGSALIRTNLTVTGTLTVNGGGNVVTNLAGGVSDPCHIVTNLGAYTEGTVWVTRANGEYQRIVPTNNITIAIDQSSFPATMVPGVYLGISNGAFTVSFDPTTISTNGASSYPRGSGGVTLTNAESVVLLERVYGSTNRVWGVLQME